MNFLAKIAFMILAGILPAFAGVCDTPKVKKQLDEFLFVHFNNGIRSKNDFYLKPAISFNKDFGVQMEIRDIYKGEKNTLCAVKVRLNALHVEIPNTDAFEKFLIENDRNFYNRYETETELMENVKNILRIYAYNKWNYNKGYLWHFNEEFSRLQGLEGLTFYRVKFGDVQDSLFSRDFLRLNLNDDDYSRKYGAVQKFKLEFKTLKKLELECEKDENAEMFYYGPFGNDELKCDQLKFLPALEKNYEWITGEKLENLKLLEFLSENSHFLPKFAKNSCTV